MEWILSQFNYNLNVNDVLDSFILTLILSSWEEKNGQKIQIPVIELTLLNFQSNLHLSITKPTELKEFQSQIHYFIFKILFILNLFFCFNIPSIWFSLCCAKSKLPKPETRSMTEKWFWTHALQRINWYKFYIKILAWFLLTLAFFS